VRIIAATHRDLDAAIGAGRFREDLFYRLNVFPVQMPPLRERLEDLPVLIDHLLQRHGQIAGRRIRLDKDAMNCLARDSWPGNVRELANLLERLAILYPEQTVRAADLPERYRNMGTTAWFGSGLALVPLARDARKTASASPALLEELLETGETVYSETNFEDAVEDAAEDRHVAMTAELKGFELPRGGMDLKDHLSTIEVGLIRKALAEADGTVAEAARLLGMRRTTLVEKLRKYRLSA
jgi:sigma-54 specific flagellar transcriptional regulator A